MNASRPCKRTPLAAGPHVTIESCSCSMVHLSLGALTVRFTPEAFRGLGSMVTAAIQAMSGSSLGGEGELALAIHDGSRRVRGEA